jgi:nucleotide-binding universal stress UspA family protein
MEDENLLARRLSQDSIAKFLRDELHYHKKQLNSFLAQYNLSSDSDEVNLVKGKPAETIADTIESSQVDLLVMGTNARTGVSGFFIGNTAEKVLSKAACSVLALKPSGFNASISVDARG